MRLVIGLSLLMSIPASHLMPREIVVTLTKPSVIVNSQTGRLSILKIPGCLNKKLNVR